MKTQFWYIILLLMSILLLSLFFGKKIIHEGNSETRPVNSETGPIITNTDLQYPVLKQDLKDTSRLLNNISIQRDDVDNQNKNIQKQIAASDIAITNLQSQISSTQISKDNLLAEKIKNSYVPEVVNLSLTKDAINNAEDLGISDPSNKMKKMNMEMDGTTPTNLIFNTKAEKACVFFKYDPNNKTDLTNSLKNYISFPFVNPSQFSFCIWIYIDTRDTNKYTVLSITNKTTLTPSVQLHVQGKNENGNYISYVTLDCSIPSPLTYGVTSSGWIHLTYTYDSNANSSMYINTNLVSSSPSGGIFYASNIRQRPNYILIGRSGDSKLVGFNGYARNFSFFAIVLQSKDVLEMYNYTK
jgi:hypothetical protein